MLTWDACASFLPCPSLRFRRPPTAEMVEFEPVAGNEIWLPDDAPSWEDLGANGQTRFMRKNGIPLDNLDGLGVARIRTLYEQARPESMDDIINPEDEEDWPTDWGNQEGEDEEEPADIVIAGGGSSSNGMGAGSGSGAGRGSRRRGAGRNGKGYRAVELPIELIQYVSTSPLVYDVLSSPTSAVGPHELTVKRRPPTIGSSSISLPMTCWAPSRTRSR
jgi:hypothetical protein